MSYSSDPVLDAARHYDAIAAENEAIEDLEIAATQEIMDTLTKQIRTATNLTFLILGCTYLLLTTGKLWCKLEH